MKVAPCIDVSVVDVTLRLLVDGVGSDKITADCSVPVLALRVALQLDRVHLSSSCCRTGHS